MIDIDISQYKLISPESIKKCNGLKRLIDIEVEEDNTFYIKGENDLILSHNCDGDNICGLLLNFFSRWPELLNKKIIYRAITPLLVVKSKKEKLPFYSFEEFEEWKNKHNIENYEISYKKGLGSLETLEFSDLIKNTKLIAFRNDLETSDLVESWFNDKFSYKRKEILMNE